MPLRGAALPSEPTGWSGAPRSVPCSDVRSFIVATVILFIKGIADPTGSSPSHPGTFPPSGVVPICPDSKRAPGKDELEIQGPELVLSISDLHRPEATLVGRPQATGLGGLMGIDEPNRGWSPIGGVLATRLSAATRGMIR